jgi:hypothetical protein
MPFILAQVSISSACMITITPVPDVTRCNKDIISSCQLLSCCVISLGLSLCVVNMPIMSFFYEPVKRTGGSYNAIKKNGVYPVIQGNRT